MSFQIVFFLFGPKITDNVLVSEQNITNSQSHKGFENIHNNSLLKQHTLARRSHSMPMPVLTSQGPSLVETGY